MAWLRGEFDAAGSHLEQATARPGRSRPARDRRGVDSSPTSRSPSAHLHLALLGLVRGDLTGVEAELAQVARRAEQARLPPGSVQPGLRALRGDLDAHRSRPARPGRGAGRRPDRAGRAARLRRMAAVGRLPSRPPSTPWPRWAPRTPTRPRCRITSRPSPRCSTPCARSG